MKRNFIAHLMVSSNIGSRSHHIVPYSVASSNGESFPYDSESFHIVADSVRTSNMDLLPYESNHIIADRGIMEKMNHSNRTVTDSVLVYNTQSFSYESESCHTFSCSKVSKNKTKR